MFYPPPPIHRSYLVHPGLHHMHARKYAYAHTQTCSLLFAFFVGKELKKRGKQLTFNYEE